MREHDCGRSRARACRNSSSLRRPGIDLPAGACAHFRLRFVRAPDPHHYSADFRFVVAEQLRECGIEADIVLDSGPAVAVSAVLAAERNRDAVVLVLAADQPPLSGPGTRRR